MKSTAYLSLAIFIAGTLLIIPPVAYIGAGLTVFHLLTVPRMRRGL